MKNTKIKKMSLLNIEGRLSPSEMENIMAGSCDPQYQVMIASLAGGMFFGNLGAFGFGAYVYYLTQKNGGRCI